MTRARRELLSIETTPYYHVISRCVRRAYLCGTDNFSGKNYEHRKAWVVERLRELDKVFTIDLCAYAVMSNHIHLVVRLDNARANSLSDEAVIRRWARLYQLPVLIQRYRKGAVNRVKSCLLPFEKKPRPAAPNGAFSFLTPE